MQYFVKSRVVAAGLASAVIVGLTVAANAETSATPPSVLIFDQKPQDGKVMIEYAHLPRNGYVVLYGADKNGLPVREPLGHIELKAGDHRKFAIKLNNAPQSGEPMWAALYVDKDNKPGFDKTADASIWNDELPLENRFVVR
jgi:hypothetical protein